MAVNYPAREFGIKRGDSFEIIQEKSLGKCIALHLPVKSYETVESFPDGRGNHLINESIEISASIENGIMAPTSDEIGPALGDAFDADEDISNRSSCISRGKQYSRL